MPCLAIELQFYTVTTLLLLESFVLGFLMHLVQLQYRELGVAMLESLWPGLELALFCSFIVLLGYWPSFFTGA